MICWHSTNHPSMPQFFILDIISSTLVWTLATTRVSCNCQVWILEMSRYKVFSCHMSWAYHISRLGVKFGSWHFLGKKLLNVICQLSYIKSSLEGCDCQIQLPGPLIVELPKLVSFLSPFLLRQYTYDLKMLLGLAFCAKVVYMFHFVSQRVELEL